MEEKAAPKRYLLRLYNADRTGEMEQLAKRFEEVLNDQLPDCYTVEIVDVMTDPERAVEDDVFVTPTLVKALPEPVRRVVGDIGDPPKILMMLGLFAVSSEREGP